MWCNASLLFRLLSGNDVPVACRFVIGLFLCFGFGILLTGLWALLFGLCVAFCLFAFGFLLVLIGCFDDLLFNIVLPTYLRLGFGYCCFCLGCCSSGLFCGSVLYLVFLLPFGCLLVGLVWFGLRFDLRFGYCDFDLR